MRFNPPPSWPQPPAGWTPPPGWQPDLASLPPVPQGWQLWLPDDDPAAPSVAPAATDPAPAYPAPVGHPATPGPTTPGLTTPGFSPTAFPQPTAFGALGTHPSEEALHTRRGATRVFWIGVAVLVGATVSTILASGDSGGFIWTGGFVVGIGLLIRALVAYRGARGAGAPAYSARGWLGAAGGLVACVVVGVVAVVSYAAPGTVLPHVATGVGSCWDDAGDAYLEPVDCGDPHAYLAVEQVAVADSCPVEAAWYVEADDSGFLCLREDA